MKKCKKGYVKQVKKCVKRTINPTTWFSVKKKNSPFKMWGSYVGAIIAIIFVWITIIPIIYIGGWIPAIITSIVAGILGFLIGWGIHSLIRRLK